MALTRIKGTGIAPGSITVDKLEANVRTVVQTVQTGGAGSSVRLKATANALPATNNTDGDMAFVQDEGILYIWSANAWTIASGTPRIDPAISSVSPTNFGGDSGTTITVYGANFDLGTVVDFIDSGGGSYRASSTTVVSQVELQAVTPKGFTVSDGPLDIKVTTSAGGTDIFLAALQTGATPNWTTAAGNLHENAYAADVIAGLNSYRLGMNVNETIAATDPDGQSVTYSIESGSLPTNANINANTGVISGTLPSSMAGDTTFSFTAGASDSAGNKTTRAFDIIVRNIQPPIYDFTSVTFKSATTGQNGPTSISTIINASTFAESGWYNDTNHLTMSAKQGIFRWTVPDYATYRIRAVGAAGYSSTTYDSTHSFGADIQGDIVLSTGDYLYILIGQYGTTSSVPSTPGGGGTFVVSGASPFTSPTPLIIAGGGAGNGSANNTFSSHGGYGGVITTKGGIPQLKNSTYGTTYPGDNGTGGQSGDGSSGGGGGGGLLTDGGPKSSNGGFPGYAFINGGVGGSSRDGGSYGGFGGGGGNWESSGAGGAGGGYSGGGASNSSSTPSHSGGGGSYNAGTNPVNIAGYGADNLTGSTASDTNLSGFVVITKL